MKYIIDNTCYFCGWDGLPFAIYSNQMQKPLFMNKEQFLLLWSCDGKTDIDAASLETDIKQFFDSVIAERIVKEASDETELQLHHYKKYPCRYRKDVQLSITGKCNYRCKHCFQSAPHGILGQPTTEQVCKELDQIAECGVKNVSITGGEPLIHEGFWQIVDHLIEDGLRLTTIYSNGSLVNQDLINEFKKRNLYPSWQISFDGLGQHDYLRGIKGAEASAISAIKLLIANGFRVGCAYTLTKRTLPVFRESVNYLASIGVCFLKSGCTMAQGEWLNCKEEWLSDEDYLNFYKEYIPQYLKDGRPLNLQFEGLFIGRSDKTLFANQKQHKELTDTESGIYDPAKQDPSKISNHKEETEPYTFMKQHEISEKDLAKFLTCGVLDSSFYIGPTGSVVPCMGMDSTPVAKQFPTLWEVPLKDILSKGSRLIEATSYTMKDVFDHNEECKDCRQRLNCGSGCRAAAIGNDGKDYLALDKHTCLICKEEWTKKINESIGKEERL